MHRFSSFPTLPGPTRARLAAAWAALLLLQACGDGVSREPGVEWQGKPLGVAERVAGPDDDALQAAGWAAPVTGAFASGRPRLLLRVIPGAWGDTLHLLDFENEVAAYAAFQQLAAAPEDIAAGVSPCGDRVCFRRGRWIGILDAWSWKGASWIGSALALPGDAPFATVPEVFGSLLHQGRMPGSERVLSGEFMGRDIAATVFAVQADCRGDTALIYAARGLKTDFARALAGRPGWGLDTAAGHFEVFSEFSELAPVRLRFSRKGMVGVEGCFDEKLTSEWLARQERALKKLK